MSISSFFKGILNFLVPNKKTPRATSAVIVAGGSSTRMGDGVSKQLLELCGIPVIVRTLIAFEETPEIGEIVLVAKKDETELYEEFKKNYNLKKLKKVVVGGNTRQLSAAKGFSAISDKSGFVAIHDGARCLITPEEISSVCNSAYTYNAASAACQVHDTVKLSTKDGFVDTTLDRNSIWLAQTPQVFSCDLYRAALAVCSEDGISVTDDNGLIEHISHSVKLVKCSNENIKITTVDDILYAKTILKKRINKSKEIQQ